MPPSKHSILTSTLQHYRYIYTAVILNQLKLFIMRQYKILYKVIPGVKLNEDQNIVDISPLIPGDWEILSFQVVNVDRPSQDKKTHVYHFAILCFRDLD